ncbi:MAG: response regulator [Ruminococcus sp.]|jgi:signal transduction histidine kinase/CheY-like chemotaxis protein|nr:response regulator [Ruminococcus sp.]
MDNTTVILSALNNVSILLMGLDQSESRLIFWNALKILGSSLGASTVSVWKNYTADSALFAHRESSWTTNTPLFKIPESDNLNLTELNPIWTHRNVQPYEMTFSGTMLPDDIRNFFSPIPFGTLHIIPVTYNSEFWGVLTYTYALEDHCFSDGEKSILNSAGLLFASAIARKEIIRSLYEAKEAALASMKAKTDFLSRMSHEMRTPLNAVIGMAKIAAETKDVNKKDVCLERISSSSTQLLAIVNDVLDMSKIDSNKMEIVPGDVQLDRLIKYVVDLNSAKILQKNIYITVNCEKTDRYVVTDGIRLAQILSNILSNAVKFTPENGFITVEVKIHRQIYGNSSLICEIMDNGIGIKKDDMSTLFNAFEQADGGITRKFGGTGLGLTISKKLVELMGGEITVISEKGEGSVFKIELPFSWGEVIVQKPERQSIIEQYNWTGKRILLVEDIEINREIVLGLLHETGVTIDFAENGKIAVDKYLANPDAYNIILMDIQMPVMDGITAAKRIRNSGYITAERIPIYAMTANAFREDEEKCFRAGMNGHIPKPIDADKLREIINKELMT